MAGGRPFLLPNPAYRKWFSLAMKSVPGIRASIETTGLQLPIQGPVTVSAEFYVAGRGGDADNYQKGLGDWLKISWKNHPTNKNKRIKLGAGIIKDDSQITHWRDVRVFRESTMPRVELTITTHAPQQRALTEAS
jgi:Holliday junction resolvase RusA-like endonuclease